MKGQSVTMEFLLYFTVFFLVFTTLYFSISQRRNKIISTINFIDKKIYLEARLSQIVNSSIISPGVVNVSELLLNFPSDIRLTVYLENGSRITNDVVLNCTSEAVRRRFMLDEKGNILVIEGRICVV